MTGYLYDEDEPTEICPYCGEVCQADFVDNGVAYQQCGPFHCRKCGASEISERDEPRSLTIDEERTGWYAPGTEPGSSANVIGGKIVSHKEMNEAYRREFTGNPQWEDKAYVRNWWREIRKP